MYSSSEEHVFARLERIRERATRLLHGEPSPAAPIDAEEGREDPSLSSGVQLRLPRLIERFALEPLAADALLCLLAAEFDPLMRTLQRAVQREVGRPWLELGTVAELLGLTPRQLPALVRTFGVGGPMRRWAMVSCDDPAGTEAPGVATRVKLSARLAQHLVGDDTLPEELRLCDPPRDTLPHSLVPTATVEAIAARVRRAVRMGESLVVEISGPAGTGRRALAEGLAHAAGLPLVIGDLAAEDPRRIEDRVAELRREARLAHALPCLAHWDRHLPSASAASLDDSHAAPAASTQRRLPAAFERFFRELDQVAILTAEEREPLLDQHAVVLHVSVPFPSPTERARLLEAALHRHGRAPAADADLYALGRRFALDPARIESAARAAVELQTERDPEATEVGRSELHEACRHQLGHDLKSLAARVTATHRWEDLVIPVEVYHQLKEMIAYARHAERVYDTWGFGARHSLSRGVSALFAGPPGTGKTMCASVMARELDMELFRVDLSRVVSKWIGETEKNLGRIFDEAQRSSAIILFDEADALFAKRTEVKSSVDRYANLEINFLLQRMESYGGVTLLTTNFEDTLDVAFKRRLTFRMRFEKPDAEARAALWRKVFPAEAELSPDVDPERLGRLYELCGGNIRNAAIRAAFMAAAQGGPIDQRTCMIAAEREAREMGLLVRSALSAEEADDEAPLDPGEPPEPGGRPAGAEESGSMQSAVGAGDAAAPKKSGDGPRLVPITRPRRPPT